MENTKQEINGAIAIIGCGNMGSAIAERLSSKERIFLYDHNTDKSKHLEAQGFGVAKGSIKEAISDAQIVIPAIKPQNLKSSAKEIQDHLSTEHVMVSLLAGTTLATLRTHFPKGQLVRMMPNLALRCGEGMIGLSEEDDNRAYSKKSLESRFSPLGKILWLPESQMNAFTALAGSGPAFIFALIEAMVEAGIVMGFSSQEAQAIVDQMVLGSVALLEATKKHPAELKWQVTSPGGTTIAGLKVFEEHAVRAGILNTFLATYQKAISME